MMTDALRLQTLIGLAALFHFAGLCAALSFTISTGIGAEHLWIFHGTHIGLKLTLWMGLYVWIARRQFGGLKSVIGAVALTLVMVKLMPCILLPFEGPNAHFAVDGLIRDGAAGTALRYALPTLGWQVLALAVPAWMVTALPKRELKLAAA